MIRALVASVELLFVIRHECVQFVHVDIGQDRADDGALRRAGVGGVPRPVFHVPCPKEFPDQRDEVFILYPPSQNFCQDVLVYVVEAALDVSFNEPFDSCVGSLNLAQCCVSASSGAEAVGLMVEGRLIDAFQNHVDDLLYELVIRGGNPQRTFLPVFLGYVLSPYRSGLIGTVAQLFDDAVDSFHSHAVHGCSVDSGSHASVVDVDVLVSEQVELGIEQVSVQPLVLVLEICCFAAQTVQYITRISQMPHAPFLVLYRSVNCLPLPCIRLSLTQTTMKTPLPYQIFRALRS